VLQVAKGVSHSLGQCPQCAWLLRVMSEGALLNWVLYSWSPERCQRSGSQATQVEGRCLAGVAYW
jgi:hypothetical protein